MQKNAILEGPLIFFFLSELGMLMRVAGHVASTYWCPRIDAGFFPLRFCFFSFCVSAFPLDYVISDRVVDNSSTGVRRVYLRVKSERLSVAAVFPEYHRGLVLLILIDTKYFRSIYWWYLALLSIARTLYCWYWAILSISVVYTGDTWHYLSIARTLYCWYWAILSISVVYTGGTWHY